MKSLLNKVIYLLGPLLLVSLSGLSGTVYAEESDEKKGDFVRGAKSWSDNCMRCHHIRDPKELRDDQWITTTFHMRIRAGLTGQQVRDIIAFLQRSN